MVLNRALPVALLLLFASTPAFSATFYVVQDTTTKKCTVVTKKPTSKTMVVVNEAGMMFKTHAEADAAVKKTKVCVTK